MKIIIFVILISLLSCGESGTETQDRIMSELECPVILIGKNPITDITYISVVRDGRGRIYTISSSGGDDGYKMPRAINGSRNIGDTLKPCK